MGAPVDGPSNKRRSKKHRIEDVNRPMTLRQAQLFARKFSQNSTLFSPKYRERISKGLEDGTLNPMIEKVFLDMARWTHKNMVDWDGAVGLLNFLTRIPITEDPLAEAKPVEGKVIESLPLPAWQPVSIVPPSRPKKPKGSGPPLKPGEEILD